MAAGRGLTAHQAQLRGGRGPRTKSSVAGIKTDTARRSSGLCATLIELPCKSLGWHDPDPRTTSGPQVGKLRQMFSVLCTSPMRDRVDFLGVCR